jgi:prepilin-type processing-associated H-X9-DG protein
MTTLPLRRAATSVDLLAVSSSVLIGLALLIPALTRAREGQNAAICLANLKQLGYGISMYVADQAGYLPGPTAVPVSFNLAPIFVGNSHYEDYYRHTLTALIAPYVGGNGPADMLAYCPTAEGIPPGSNLKPPWWCPPRTYYVLNSFKVERNFVVKYGTDPTCYFGMTSLYQQTWSGYELPKPLARVKNPSREWALADMWYWEAMPPRGLVQPAGTWGFLLTDRTVASRIYNEGYLVPTYPFHNTTKTFSPAGTDFSFTALRITSGQTNTVFFDGHAAGVRNWTGSVNPCATSLCN